MPEPTRKPLQPLAGTARWISGGLGLGAALATILASAHSCGLIGDDSTRLSVAGLAVSWVGLAPSADTAGSVGDTLRYVATVTDRRGTALVGAPIDWKVEDSTVATVDSAGFVLARAPGATILTASVHGKSARARVVVRPRAARFEFGADSIVRVAEGGRTGVSVRALDARGHVIRRSLAGLEVADTALATVLGRELAGRNAGRTALVAELDGLRDSIPLLVVPVPGKVTLLEGGGQHGAVESRLADPVVVRVDSRMGRPMAGVAVRFTAPDGGAARPDSVVSGPDGLAGTTWTTGDRPGLVRLVATVPGVDSSAVVLADIEPSRANTLVAQLGDPPSGLAAGAQPVGVAVVLTDSSGRVLAGVPVTWKALDGGAITPREARSDSAGEVRADWRLGPRAGVQHARVLVGSGRTVPPLTVIAAGFPGAPAKLKALGPATIAGTVGAALAKPLLVRVTDSVGNGVPGVAISATAGAGSVGDSVVASDSTGKAAIPWTLGEKAGPQTLTLAVDGVAAVRFTAQARPAAAANLEFLEAAQQVARGKSRPARVRVTDAYGNPVSGVLVTFAASKGSVKPGRVMTDHTGVAAASWTLPRLAGSQTLTATLPKGGVKDVWELTGPAAPAAPVVSRPSRLTAAGTKTSARRPKPRT